VKTAHDTRDILDKLETQHPGADTELHFSTAYGLLVATILSAQSTDALVNTVTPVQEAPDARALARARGRRSKTDPPPASSGRNRSRDRDGQGPGRAHDGEVPATMDALVELPGVGRKTANVVLGHALAAGLPVDRHVLRVANRIGIAESDDPVTVEQQLAAALEPGRWTRVRHADPARAPHLPAEAAGDACVVRDDCDYFQTAAVVREAKPAYAAACRSNERRRASRAVRTPRR
jgi:endonuclease-3